MATEARQRRTYGGKPLSSKYRGVQAAAGGKFMSLVVVKGKRYHLGTWPTEEDAAVARDRAVLHLQLRAVALHFPERATEAGPAAPEELMEIARRLGKEGMNKSRYFGVWRYQKGKWTAAIRVAGRFHQRSPVNC